MKHFRIKKRSIYFYNLRQSNVLNIKFITFSNLRSTDLIKFTYWVEISRIFTNFKTLLTKKTNLLESGLSA